MRAHIRVLVAFAVGISILSAVASGIYVGYWAFEGAKAFRAFMLQLQPAQAVTLLACGLTTLALLAKRLDFNKYGEHNRKTLRLAADQRRPIMMCIAYFCLIAGKAMLVTVLYRIVADIFA